jgi:hypothetical protein
MLIVNKVGIEILVDTPIRSENLSLIRIIKQKGAG